MNATLTDIRDECEGFGTHDPEYFKKQIHKVPDAPVVKRVDYILNACKDKVVLSLGCSGRLQPKIEAVAKESYGLDIDPQKCGNFRCMDLDDIDDPRDVPGPWRNIELVVAGEILEHLTNPGQLLRALKLCRCPVLITVPNSHTDGGRYFLSKGFENVNSDHVAYYSWFTLKKLVEKCGYEVKDFAWYNGKPLFAEGLIMVVE